MIVRDANPDVDMDAIIDGAHDFLSRMVYKIPMPNDLELRAIIEAWIRTGTVNIKVAEQGGRIVGCIGMIYAQFHWNPRLKIGDEMFWWVAQDAKPTAALALIRAAFNDMKEKSIDLASFKTLTSSPSGVARVYSKFGLQEVETSYMGALKWQ